MLTLITKVYQYTDHGERKSLFSCNAGKQQIWGLVAVEIFLFDI